MALDKPVSTPTKRLGAILIEEGMITEGQLREALEAKREQGGFLGKILVEKGFLKEPDLISFLVKQCKIPHISLTEYDIDLDLINLVSKDLCLQYGLIPIDNLGTILTIAMVDPLDQAALEAVRRACPNHRIKPILCTWNHYEHVMRRLYPETRPQKDAAEASMDDFGLSSSSGLSSKKAAPQKTASSEDNIPDAQIDEALPDSPMSPEQFREFVDREVRRSVETALHSIADRVRDQIQVNNGQLPVSTSELVDALRAAFDEARDDAAGSLLYRTQQAIERFDARAGDLSAQDLKELLHHSLRRAINESFFHLLGQVAWSLTDGDPRHRR